MHTVLLVCPELHVVVSVMLMTMAVLREAHACGAKHSNCVPKSPVAAEYGESDVTDAQAA